MEISLYNEDCIATMQSIEENSIDALCSDPPYLINFMNKEFDGQHKKLPGENEGKKMYNWHLNWLTEAFRILKPGAYLLAFAGSRTYHRLVCAAEDVGFEIRGMIGWVYATGFPKALNAGLEIDRVLGVESKIIENFDRTFGINKSRVEQGYRENEVQAGSKKEPVSEEGKKWAGFFYDIKPAMEPIVLARKPLSEDNVAKNILRWGVGALNIDGCRIGETGWTKKDGKHSGSENGHIGQLKNRKEGEVRLSNKGRYPSNFLLNHSSLCKFIGNIEVKNLSGSIPEGSGPRRNNVYGKDERSRTSWKAYGEDGYETISKWECAEDCPSLLIQNQSDFSKTLRIEKPSNCGGNTWGGTFQTNRGARGHTDEGYADRFYFNASFSDEDIYPPFFYVAKPSKKERDSGLETAGDKIKNRVNPGGLEKDKKFAPIIVKNNHVSVKPISLMRYLCRLITPPNGLVIDPFMGSGTTGIAAKFEEFSFIGIELDSDYFEIAKQRIKNSKEPSAKKQKKNPKPAVAAQAQIEFKLGD